MPILQRIEISNFLNSTRAKPWRPDWPHQVFEINGENAALNIPNGKGKSTMVAAILAMLTHHSKTLKDLRTRFFAPVQSGRYTHIRIQVLIPVPGASSDLITSAGGEFGGQPMVFGMYGYAGENEKLEFYAYQGGFEDAPIAHVHNLHHTLIADDAFLGQLKTCQNLFPSNHKERTKRAWQTYVEDFFDISSINQQLIYQLKRGAEGGHGYFEVTQPVGMNYSAAVFYERLAPELLTDVMGDLGEEGEHGIEDTIHEKVSKVISAKYQTEKKAEELRRAENSLKALSELLAAGDKLQAAQLEYDGHRKEFSLELAVLKNVVVDAPIPGIPKLPPETVPDIAMSMVLQDGKWYLPDRVKAEFTGEPPSEVNRRAQDRNGIALVHASKSQLIDIACHLMSKVNQKGHSNQLYSRDSAIALLNITSNFTKEWNRVRAIEAVTQAFDWVEANADTNPARILLRSLEAELHENTKKHRELTAEYSAYKEERESLITEQSTVGEQQAEYRRMSESGLFTDEEMTAPLETGERATKVLQDCTNSLDTHKDKVRELSDTFQAWQSFVAEHGDQARPADKADEIELSRKTANTAVKDTREALQVLRGLRRPLEEAERAAKRKLDSAEIKLGLFTKTQAAFAEFTSIFGEVSPVGMGRKVIEERDKATQRIALIGTERLLYRSSLDALAKFHSSYGEIRPNEWLEKEAAAWQAVGDELRLLKEDLHECELRRADLDKAVIVAGRVAREAAAVAGGAQLPLHAAIAKMELDEQQREKALTLFSALLHTPVYQTVEEAAEAATRLEQAGIEAPVFVFGGLEHYCQTGQISLDAGAAYTWLVGVRTRQVDCLLDPSLVEREKELTDSRIAGLKQEIQSKETERLQHSPEGDAAKLARKAQEATDNGYEAKDATLVAEASKLTEQLPELEARTSDEIIEIIRLAEQHHKEFKGVAVADLNAELDGCRESAFAAEQARTENDRRISETEKILEEQQITLSEATIASSKVVLLRKIQVFIDHPEHNPAFMAKAEYMEKVLEQNRDAADQRTRFRFELADSFIKHGHERPRQIETRLKHLEGELAEIGERLLPKLDATIQDLDKQKQGLSGNAMKIDSFALNLMRRYREFANSQDDLVEIGQDQIERHSLGGAAIGLRDNAGPKDAMNMLLAMMDDVEFEESVGIKAEMNRSRQEHRMAKQAFSSEVDKILVMGGIDLTDHVKLELERSKEKPEIIEHLHKVSTLNFEQNSRANATAKAYLDDEWANIGEWLKKFTKRLPDNLRTMKNVFGPARDKVTGEYLSAGFEIEAQLADQDDIKAILGEVVEWVEKFEATKQVTDSVSPFIGAQAVKEIRSRIRNTFYQKVITNPRVRVYMPSISPHPLPLEKNMVSTGQGVAMTLLWVVKMADYVTERELRRTTTNRVQQKHLHPTQFAIMDGAFSSLSNKGLIQDALDCIKQTRGRFQLIITGHDENYQNNFEYFPTLIEAREINGQYMYADSKTRRVLQPDEIGSHYGAMESISLRVKPQTHVEVVDGA